MGTLAVALWCGGHAVAGCTRSPCGVVGMQSLWVHAVALGVVGPCGCPVQLVISEQPYAAHLPALLTASSRKRFPKPDNYKDVL